MEKIGLNELREMFQEFYQSKDHYRAKSFPLIPRNDKSLLIINSGMAPLKPYFAGIEKPPAPRMVTVQKCIRTADIENVGYTARHGTFFEMMGSFSFGDYFKEESLVWGWEFMTEVLKLPEEKLWASVYEEDDEAYHIWKDVIGMPEEKIVRLGKDDNFWEIGTGPCGPCSEVYYDRGEEYGCDDPDCKPGCDCDRYIEFWNHVFTQFNSDGKGNYTDLEHKNIDTGMGLERIACIMQDVDSIFAVDTIETVLNAVSAKAGIPYQNGRAETDVSIRIITDHIRSASFMVGDMILPSNEGRGYVLRRIIRRAARHGRKLGIQGAFLSDLVDHVVDTCAGAYPELEERHSYIKKIIGIEERKFSDTLNQGMQFIEGYIQEMRAEGSTVLSGDKAFKLHDTYGFPIDFTEEILKEEGLQVDIDGFEANMKKQVEAGQADASLSDEGWKEKSIDYLFDESSEFTGYDSVMETADIMGIFSDGKPLDVLKEGEEGTVVLNKTPFYTESGGQASDRGIIYNDDGRAFVKGMVKFNNVIGHRVKILNGSLKNGTQVEAMIEEPYRNRIARNHTATHMLHKALREVLGEHVAQAGSSVTADNLRFDFNHFEAMTKDQILKVEKQVNSKIDFFMPVEVREMSLKDAAKEGAVGLFEEKYGDTVRVVSVGDYSKELCGGTHVSNSGQIGAFRILSESGIASGVRRIEAITGTEVVSSLASCQLEIEKAASALKTTPEMLSEKTQDLVAENKARKKELDELKKKSLDTVADKLIDDSKEVNGIRFVARSFKNMDIDSLRTISDDVKSKHKNVAMVFAAQNDDKVIFLISLTDDVVAKGYHAGKMIKEVAAAAGGGGGGKADMAQAGGKDPEKIHKSFTVAESLLAK